MCYTTSHSPNSKTFWTELFFCDLMKERSRPGQLKMRFEKLQPLFKRFCLFLVGIALFSSQSCVSDTTKNSEDQLGKTITHNSLNEKEKIENWKLLFNGKDLNEWRGFKMETVPPGWTIQETALYFSSEGGAEGGRDLMTKDRFSDFELKMEWKIPSGANSGIFYRVSEDYDEEYMTGPEFQIIDDEAYFNELRGTQLSGANYGLHAPSKHVAKPAGKWNQMRLIVKGSHVEHWLNKEKIVKYNLWDDQWKELVENSKFSQWSGYGINHEGHIVFQDHGTPVWFRNIKIKLLEPAP